MTTPAHYRSEAAELRKLAAKSRDPAAVNRWLQMALEYEYLARTLDTDRRVAVRPQARQHQQANPSGDGE